MDKTAVVPRPMERSKLLAGWLSTLRKLAIAGGGMTCLITLLGYFGEWRWYLDLCAHFRVQYVVILWICAAVVLRAHPRWAALFLLCGTGSLLSVLPFYFGTGSVQESETTLRVLSINVNMKTGDPAQVGQLAQSVAPDLLLLVEVNTRWLRELAPYVDALPHSAVVPREDHSGIALFSKFPIASHTAEFLKSPSPTVIAAVQWHDHEISVVGTHPLPPTRGWKSSSRNMQLAAIAERVRVIDTPVLLLGDLNTTPWSAHFRKLVKNSGLRDSARGFGFQPTWPSWLPPLLMIPIDHCLHSPEFRVLQRRVGPNVASDHLPLFTELELVATDLNQPPEL